jgi:hypothetical protein
MPEFSVAQTTLTVYDACADAFAGSALDLATTNGRCNLTLGTAPPNTSSTTANDCIAGLDRDEWVRVIADVTGTITFSYTPAIATANMSLARYNGTGASFNTCPADLNAENECRDDQGTGAGTEVLSFGATAGRSYYIRIVNETNTTYPGGTVTVTSVAAQGSVNLYDDDGLASSGTVINLQTTNNTPATRYNQVLSNAGGPDLANPAPGTITCAPADITVAAGIQREDWVKVISDVTGTLAISLSPTNTVNIALLVYESNAAGTNADFTKPPQCINSYASGITETISFSSVAGRVHFLRVVNLTNTNFPDGKVSFYQGPPVQGDLCRTAQTVTLETCNFPFEVNSAFRHDEVNATECCGRKTETDGWVKLLNIANGKSFRISYQNDDKNARIAVYSGTAGTAVCGTLGTATPAVCVNNVTIGTEIIELTNASGVAQDYYIRIINSQDSESMTGSLCLEEIYHRDNCASLATAPTLSLGACSINFDIPAAYTASTYISCGGANQAFDDSWVKFTAPASPPAMIRVEYSAIDINQDPDLQIYDGDGGTSCVPASMPLVADLCGNNDPAVAISFVPIAGKTYFIRVINANSGEAMEGLLCIYDDTKRAEDVFQTSLEFTIGGSDCGRQFNVPSSYEQFGETESDIISCATNVAVADAWGYFDVSTATVPTNGLVVEYNNNNNDATTAPDVAVVLYGKPALAASGATPSADCPTANTAPVANNTSTAFTAVPASDERWVQFTMPDFMSVQQPTIVVEFENIDEDATLELYDAACAPINAVDNVAGIGKEYTYITLPAAADVFNIRVLNNSGVNPMTGTLRIYNITEVACIDNIAGEGVEQSIIRQTDYPLFVNNERYWFRVATVASGLTTVSGTICLRENDVPDGDLCSNPIGLLVGDCDISLNFDIAGTNAFINNDPTATSCPAGPAVRDAWVTFTATTDQTTVEYNTIDVNGALDDDIAIEIYNGSCGGLVRVPTATNAADFCVGNEASEVDNGETGVDAFKINTVPGLVYYVRLVTVNNAPDADIIGSICIYNTTERDVCDDDAIATLFAGDCSVPFDIPATFDANAGDKPIRPEFREFTAGTNLPVIETGGSLTQYVQSSCEPEHPLAGSGGPFDGTHETFTTGYPASRDAWFRVIGNGEVFTLTYQNKEATSNPSIIIYTALQDVGPVNCGTGINGAGNRGNQLACANNTTIADTQTESVTFQANSGQQYLVRIIDLANAPAGMRGTLCVSEGLQNYDDPCTALEIAPGSCSIAANVLPNALNTPIPVGGSGCDGTPNGDTWVKAVRPYMCDPTLAAPMPDMSGSLISCPTPYKVNLGNDGAIGGTGAAADFCECGIAADNVCAAPTPSVSNTCPTGFVFNAGPDGVSNTADDTCEPMPMGVVCPQPFSYDAGSGTCVCAQNSVRVDGVGTLYDETGKDQIGFEYDNRNGNNEPNPNFSLALYRDPTPATCNDPLSFTYLSCAGPSTGKQKLGVSVAGLSTVHGQGGEVFYVRIIKQTAGTSLYGEFCSFFGADVASDNCPGNNNYGDLEGDFRSFTIPSNGDATTAYNNNQVNQPTNTIPNCVLPGGSSPRSRTDFPIRSDAWMFFDVPNDLFTAPGVTRGKVTVQFDNTGFSAPRNIAIAVYTDGEYAADGIDNVTGVSCTSLFPGNGNGLFLLDCSNTVFTGTESSTITVSEGVRYYVRVMNIHNEDRPAAYTGRIRVFPFASCDPGPSLVMDGDFDYWPDIDRNSTIPDNIDPAGQTAAVFDANRGDDLMFVPNLTNASAYPTALETNAQTGVVRFSTDYGFLRDRTNAGDLPAGSSDPTVVGLNQQAIRASYNELRTQQGELNPEGLFLVKQSPWTVKSDWYCFGVGFSGYGGRGGGGEPQRAYCASGAGGRKDDDTPGEPCDTVGNGGILTIGQYNPINGTGGTDRPAPFPDVSAINGDPNFMIINGSYNPASNLPPGKIWCQTVQRPGGTVGYYVFTLWAQNMISAGRNLDVPQLRMTVCDMEDTNNLGSFPEQTDIYTVANGDVNDNNVRLTRLPGITDQLDSQAPNPFVRFDEEPNSQLVRHIPRPGVNRLVALVNSGPRPAFGASAPCNIDANMAARIDAVNGATPAPSTESQNARLKILGSSFLITERPDNWVLLRCIYRAPREVTEMNICIENLSLTKNGNDIGIDRIAFQECIDADAATFDRLLKGDPCELADDGSDLGIPLPARLLAFDGKLIGNYVALNWMAIGENETSYEVERSTDGTHFTYIGKLDGKGTKNGYATYDYYDTKLPFGVSVLYYRLKIISKGIPNQGPVIDIPITALEDLDMKLVPNPASNGGEVAVQFNVSKGYAHITVTDMLGTRLQNQVVKTIDGDNSVILQTAGMQKGLYVVRVVQGARTYAKKLVVN